MSPRLTAWTRTITKVTIRSDKNIKKVGDSESILF